MHIAAHWKIYNRTGEEIDFVEKQLHEITKASVVRAETFHGKNYDALYVIRGDIDAQNLADACCFMDDAGAFPV